MSVTAGMIQIWRKCVGSVADALYSLWMTPLPADIACTSFGPSSCASPMLSLCASRPSTT